MLLDRRALLPRLTAVRSLATGLALSPLRPKSIRLLPLNAPATSPDPAALGNESIARLQHQMQARQLTAEALTSALIQAIGDDPLHSLVSLNPDLLRQAQAADQRRASGDQGALLGIPITIKDNIETAGSMPTTGGAEILLQHQPNRDADVVTALRDAGAVVVGKNNLSELAGAVVRHPGFCAVAGQTGNPRGPQYSSSGSSSGSAAAVAAGLCVASIGTETSGSLISPAASCGVVAVKPSRGMVGLDGIVPLVRHQDSAGPITRSVADACAVLAVISRGAVEGEVGNASLQGVRVGVLARDIETQKGGPDYTKDAPAVRGAVEELMTAAGARVVSAELGDDGIDGQLLSVVLGGLAHDTVGYLVAAGAGIRTLADLQSYNLSKPRRRMPAGQDLLNLAVLRAMTRQEYEQRAMDLREAACNALDRAFLASGTELLVSVSNIHSAYYASAGYPAVTIPIGSRQNGMPLGMTLIGPMGSDAWLLGMASAVEACVQ